MPETRTEWGVELIWPGGSVEKLSRGSERSARTMCDWHNQSAAITTAKLIRRTITIGDWEEVEK